LKTKFFERNVLSFTSQFWTKKGPLPDLLKYAGKAISRIVKSEEEFLEYQLGVKNWLALIKNYEGKREALQCAAVYYSVSVGDVEICFDFLEAYCKLSYQEFSKYSRPRTLWIVNLSNKFDGDLRIDRQKESLFVNFQHEHYRQREDDDQKSSGCGQNLRGDPQSSDRGVLRGRRENSHDAAFGICYLEDALRDGASTGFIPGVGML